MKTPIFFYFLLIPICLLAQKKENKVKRIYYNDNIIAFERYYGDYKKIDSIKTYYKSGELDELFYFDENYYQGESYKFNRKGERITTWDFNKGKLISRVDHKISFNKKTKEKVQKAYTQIKEVNEAIKKNPNSLKSRYKRARYRRYLGNKVLALNDFKKIEKRFKKIQKKETIPEKLLGGLYDHLAGIYSSYEMENKTIHYKLKAIQASPKESRLYNNLGTYLVKKKQYRLGINYLNKAIEMVPNHSFANWSLSKAYTDLEDYEKAMTCVNIAFENETSIYKRGSKISERDLRTIRGLLHHKLNDSDKGIADLKEALNINSNNSFALRNLGVIYHDLEEYNKSCDLLQKSRELGYEKIHDRLDLEDYLEYSCNNKASENNVLKFHDKPYIYPNPAKDIIRINNFNFENFNYSIYNFESKLIHQGKAKNNMISVSNLPTGLYILKIETNNEMNTFKLIKE